MSSSEPPPKDDEEIQLAPTLVDIPEDGPPLPSEDIDPSESGSAVGTTAASRNTPGLRDEVTQDDADIGTHKVVPPTMGGTITYGGEKVFFCGGKPLPDWSGNDPSAAGYLSPLQLRANRASGNQKGYAARIAALGL